MPTLRGSPRFSALVQKRTDGKLRQFRNVIEASSVGMAYDPADYNLMVVHEPKVGYRMINLDGVIREWKPKTGRLARVLERAKELSEMMIL